MQRRSINMGLIVDLGNDKTGLRTIKNIVSWGFLQVQAIYKCPTKQLTTKIIAINYVFIPTNNPCFTWVNTILDHSLYD